MKYLDEFRDPALAQGILGRIRHTATRPWAIMEVCGGQTHSLLRHGIEQELTGVVELLHGPGCPVCVTPAAQIDIACQLALRPGVILASFGDMLRVPGNRGSLLNAKGQGGRVRLVYSPLDAVELAKQNPTDEVVFFAVGFETTVPTTALAVLQADRLGLTNFCVLTAHVRVQPAMEAIASDPACRVNGFLAAGHVCTVAGFETYDEFTARYNMPVVVTGFEPVDLLEGIHECVRLLEAGSNVVVNQYERSVRSAGNETARQLIDRVYQIADRPWRGLGVIPRGGLVMRPEWSRFDATTRFGEFADCVGGEHDCRSGDVLSGRIRPPECAQFGIGCTPETPMGAPMVSSEGACAAYYRYARQPAGLESGTVAESRLGGL